MLSPLYCRVMLCVPGVVNVYGKLTNKEPGCGAYCTVPGIVVLPS